MTATPQPRCRKLGIWLTVGVLTVIVTLAVTNPSEARHLAAMREHATWEAPYSITDVQLQSARFRYRSYFLFSVTRLSDGIYTYGLLGIVIPTDRLRPKLIELHTTPQDEKR